MSECIEFIGAIDNTGYGRKARNGKLYMAHRLAYEDAKGPIPTGLVVDHLCFNRRCINPKHLRVTTREENSKRHNPNCLCSACNPETYRIDKCINGHVKSVTGRTKSGQCLECQRKHNREYMRRFRSKTARL